MSSLRYRVSFLIFSVFLISGCSSLEMPATVEEAFSAGNVAMQEENYMDAVKYFRHVTSEYPFSSLVEEASLSYADALFLKGYYLDAAFAYEEFEILYPRHDALPYALYQMARALRLSYTSVDRASTDVERAETILNRLILLFPNTEYADAAKEELVRVRTLIAERNVYIAQIYWNGRNYEASWNRYIYITENFADLPEIYDYAYAQSQAAYLKYREEASEDVREEREGSWKNMFNWL